MKAFFRRIKAFVPFMKDSSVPKRKKALVIFGIVYLFLPVDIIPPIFFPIGFVDDIILWMYILTHLGEELDSYAGASSDRKNTPKKFRDKNIVEGVQFEVEEEAVSDEKDSEEYQNDK